jgi:5'-3' exonuclease
MRLLVDSASLWYRAFYGVPESFSEVNGQPNNAIRGFFDGLARIVAKYRPTEIAICLDDNWRPAWRVELFPEYKSHRLEDESETEGVEAEPDLLTPQIGPILELSSLLGLATVSAEDQEADDVIATLTVTGEVGQVRIVTGDRDLFQLIRFGDAIKVIYLAKGISNHELVDGRYLEERYGIPFDRYLLFSAIRGDASDGLPGIRGIGEKGAAAIVKHFASMHDLIHAADTGSELLSPNHRKKVLQDRRYAEIAERLVSCRTDLEVNSTGLASWRTNSDLVEFRRRASEWGMGSSMERIVAALDI